MRIAFSTIIFLLVISVFGAHAQDTLNYKGHHMEFLQGTTDTAKVNGNNYIIKYVTEPEEGDVMRSNGKIYVVVTVLATIFAGIFAYLVYLDRKITRLENEK